MPFCPAGKYKSGGEIPVDKTLLTQLREMASKSSQEASGPSMSRQHDDRESQSEHTGNGAGPSRQPNAVPHETPPLTAAKIDAQEDFKDPPEPSPGAYNCSASL